MRLWPPRLPVVALLVVAGAWLVAWRLYPSDRSPEGCYLRVMAAINDGELEAAFPYLETQAQHAAFTIGKYQKQSAELIASAYPEPQRTRALANLAEGIEVADGPGVFVRLATMHGWESRLRRDLSGVHLVEQNGPRASVQTARGTRYSFRQRDNGMWGLTLFTAQLVAAAEKAARDFEQYQAAAEDFGASSGLGSRNEAGFNSGGNAQKEPPSSR